MLTGRATVAEPKKKLLSNSECRALESFWQADWHECMTDTEQGASTQRWWRAFLALINKRGDEILPDALLKSEAKILEFQLEEEYLTALREVVDSRTHRSEAAHAVLLLMATPSQRWEACQKVLSFKP